MTIPVINTTITIATLLLQIFGIQQEVNPPNHTDQQWQNEEFTTIKKSIKQKTDKITIQSQIPTVVPTEKYIPSAEAISVIDTTSGILLYGHNQNEKRPIASITKIMLAIVVRDQSEKELWKTHTVTAPYKKGANAKLETGEQLSNRDLLTLSLVPSANDAATQLAISVFDSTEEAIKRMNNKAKELNLNNTQFFNVTGLDKEDDPTIEQENYSTAFELAQILETAQKDDYIRNDMQKKTATVITPTQEHHVETTNKLLGNSKTFKGGKTGFTDKAGQSLAVYALHESHEIMTVILNAEDRFQEARNVTQWTIDNTQWPGCGKEENCGNIKE